ncbi:MAG: BlaI/MecI/CopY family transcriptional regulator, partial [Myxococcales bacterium]|nr:BlaI/MecI/CopY family transcriptional regulator [Myxococcales bacterium]
RHKDGLAWRYRSARSREATLAEEVGRVLERAEGAPERLLVAFLDQVEQVDPDALDRLEALLKARRQR